MTIKNNNKFLTFLLENENYGIPIVEVKEIIGIMPITYIPKMTKYVKGVINLRGKIIQVIDLRLKFRLKERIYDDRTCIIVVEIQTTEELKLIGFIVDMVSEVLDILPDNMDRISEYANEENHQFLKALGKVRDKVVMILDCNIIVSDKENGNIEVESDMLNVDLKTV